MGKCLCEMTGSSTSVNLLILSRPGMRESRIRRYIPLLLIDSIEDRGILAEQGGHLMNNNIAKTA